MVKKAKLTDIEASGFALDDGIRQWLAEKFPRVDPDATLELFTDKALAKGWQYASWPAAFRNYVRNGEKFGGLAFKRGLSDAAYDPLIKRARQVGFRDPTRLESAGAYRTALGEFERGAKAAAPMLREMINRAIKRVPK
jgi:hypothetical protein